jgi:hypothetical protein
MRLNNNMSWDLILKIDKWMKVWLRFGVII